MIGILRYSSGNVGSVQRACTRLGISTKIVSSPDQLHDCSGIIFPGAGAAGSAMSTLASAGWIDVLQSYKKPFLGLCLGMQLLFDYSEENETKCLGILKGQVRLLPDDMVRPHMGWNRVRVEPMCHPEEPRLTLRDAPPLRSGAPQDDTARRLEGGTLDNANYAYFVHSYYCVPDDQSVITMATNYGQELCTGVQKDNFMGVQFHPEKSAEFGDSILFSFANQCK